MSIALILLVATCANEKLLASYSVDGPAISFIEDCDELKNDRFAHGAKLIDGGKLQEAHSYFNRLIRDKPSDTSGYIGRALARSRSGKSKETIEDLTHALRLNKQSVAALRLRGFLYFELGKDDKAMQDGERLLALDKNHCHGYLLVSLVLQQKEMPHVALVLLNQGIVCSKDTRLLRFMKSSVCLGLKDYDTSLQELEAILKVDSDNESAKKQISIVKTLRSLAMSDRNEKHRDANSSGLTPHN